MKQINNAYKTKNIELINEYLNEIPVLITELQNLEESFRKVWMSHNKSNGYEKIQIRLAGQRERWRELSRRLKELVEGRVTVIPEFDENCTLGEISTEISTGYIDLAAPNTRI